MHSQAQGSRQYLLPGASARASGPAYLPGIQRAIGLWRARSGGFSNRGREEEAAIAFLQD